MRLQSLRDRFDTLSVREKQVMDLVCSGLMNKQTAEIVGLSEITVKVHRHNVMKKLGVKTLPALVRITDLLGQGRPKQLSFSSSRCTTKAATDSAIRSQVNGREYR